MTQRWVLIDESNGAACQNGEILTPEALATIAAAITLQLNRDRGVDSSCRAGSGPTDVQPGERVYTFRPDLPDAPGAIAYHAVDGQGVPFGLQAVTLCASLFGPGGCADAFSHEALETEDDPGCDQYVDNGQGQEVAKESCDPVEAQGYDLAFGGDPPIHASNFVLDSWYTAGAPGPYTFMGKSGLQDASAEPPAPFTMAPGGGNYMLVRASSGDPTAVFGQAHPAKHAAIFTGDIWSTPGGSVLPKKLAHWSSRAWKRMHPDEALALAAGQLAPRPPVETPPTEPVPAIADAEFDEVNEQGSSWVAPPTEPALPVLVTTDDGFKTLDVEVSLPCDSVWAPGLDGTPFRCKLPLHHEGAHVLAAISIPAPEAPLPPVVP